MKSAIETEHLRIFVAVVAEGSFTRAAERLATNKAHVSRVVARLEEHLDARLLERTTRAVALTEAGRELHGRARSILLALDETESALRRRVDAPAGLLRLTCAAECGLLHVNGWIAEYLRLYPAATVSADFRDRVADLLHEGLDLAIGDGDLSDPRLSARKLGEVSYGLYASPAYLAAHPAPATAKELFDHDLILFTLPGRGVTTLTNGFQTLAIDCPPRFTANTHMALCDMAVAGLGIALLPTCLGAPAVAAERLVPVLPGWSRPPVPIHAVFPSAQYLTPNLRAFIDIAQRSFAD